MTNRKSSHAQQNPASAAFPAIPGLDAWRSMMDAQATRLTQMLGEMERVEKERHERVLTTMDDVGKLIRSGVEYQAQLATQWRELGLDAARKGVAMMTPSDA